MGKTTEITNNMDESQKDFLEIFFKKDFIEMSNNF